MAWTLAPISRTDGVIYLTTLQDGHAIIVGLDWDTGEQVATIWQPNTYRIQTAGAVHLPPPRRQPPHQRSLPTRQGPQTPTLRQRWISRRQMRHAAQRRVLAPLPRPMGASDNQDHVSPGQ